MMAQTTASPVSDENFPDRGEHDRTYTPFAAGSQLGEDGSERDSSGQGKRVIDCTRALDPWASVLHLDVNPATPR